MSESADAGLAGAVPEPAENVVDYVFVVHGMGHPRRNATSVDVICRFDDACAGRSNAAQRNNVTLGATRQDRPWSEFGGILGRGKPSRDCDGAWCETGENLRFVDVHWSDITERAVEAVAEPADRWVRKVAQSLGTHQEHLKRAKTKAAVPFWLTHLVRLIRPLVHIARPVLALVNRPLGDLVFSEYLGDVQVYCECPDVRGRGVARFHRYLSGVLRCHDEAEARRVAEFVAKNPAAPAQKPRVARFTVVAHSLGSLLSLDALLAAHLPRADREAIPGYRDEMRRLDDPWRDPTDRLAPNEAELPVLPWLSNLHALVTLGCPAEKVAALWPGNHRFHVSDASVAEAMALRGASRIRHLNFLEAMDVVSDPLAFYRGSPLYRGVFEPKGHAGRQDILSTTDTRPFVAHTSYWNDVEVFRRIRHEVWEHEDRPASTTRVGNERIRDHVFGLLPTLSGIAVGLAAIAMLSAQSIGTAAASTIAFVSLTFLSVVLLRVLAWWWYLTEARGSGKLKPPRAPWWGTFYMGACLFVSALAYSFLQSKDDPLDAGLATIGLVGLSVVVWRWARDRAGHGIALAPIAIVLFVGYLFAMKHAWVSLFHGEIHGEALATTAVILGVSLCLSGQAADLPQKARILRKGSAPAFLSSWVVGTLWWGFVWGVHRVLLPAGPGGTGGASPWKANVLGFFELTTERIAIFLLFAATAIAAFLTVVHQEIALARATADLHGWEKQSWRDYLSPTFGPASAPEADSKAAKV